MFEKTLNDLVTGIRSHKRDTALFISQNIAEIKTELQSPDFFVKANALQKLTFLQMMGYSMSWAAFASVEVMSSPRFALKRVGCLAACQGLDQPEKSPVVLLTTNMLKKELRGATVGASGESAYHAGLAINCLSNIATEDLGRELLPDLLHLLKHPSPYVRKKALLCLYKVFLKYPQGLRLSFDRIKACLEDSHPSVVSCAVNVITELSDKNPRNYLPLAPAFFKLLTSSANNWMLIKVVKLLGSLVPEEPRLARKLLEPLAGMVKSTHAKSLLYEAVYAITLCLKHVQRKSDGSVPASVPEVVELCAETLRGFVADPDQNLKYLGLVGLGSLLQSQPEALRSRPDCRGLVLGCLSDEDVTIRARALGLLRFVTTQRNLADLVAQLLGHVEAAGGEYRSQLVEEIVRMCSSDKYQLVSDFAWYFDVLVALAGVRGVEDQGKGVAGQWMDVAWRVLPVRAYAVRRSMEVLACRGPGAGGVGEEGGKGRALAGDGEKHVMPEVLLAAAWVVGEYSHLIPEALEEEGVEVEYDAASAGPYHSLIQSMTAPEDAAGINPLANQTQAVFVQNAMKVFAAACSRNKQTNDGHSMGLDGPGCSDDELYACARSLMKHLAVFVESPDVEVKERSFTSLQLLRSIGLPSEVNELNSTSASIAAKCRDASATLSYILVPEPMKPISAKAQRRKLAEGPPSPVSVEEWERDVDWGAFSFFGEETPWFDKEGNVRGSVESICFTTQRASPAISAGEAVLGARGNDGFGGIGEAGISSAEGTEATSFGGISGNGASDSTMGLAHVHAPRQREGDPFYLSSAVPASQFLDDPAGGEAEKAVKDGADAVASRFGSIHLDSEGESDEAFGGSKVKRKKKKKTKKAAAGAPRHLKFVESDDEDEDHAPHQPKRQDLNKDFQNLALVDLTTPLGEDEVMPRNEHHVVPERPPPTEPTSSPKKAKKKKKKKSGEKTKRLEGSDAGAVEGDLLGFDSLALGGGTGVAATGSLLTNKSPAVTAAAVMTAPRPGANSNDPFDDLLGLEMPESQTMVGASDAATPAMTSSYLPSAQKSPKPKKAKKQKKDKKEKSKNKSR
ncbi:hypothetical protein ACHAWF_012601 [Thalassiosira exigua]